jgi:phosphomannomutase
VRALGGAAGVMVTASHNPAPDNGYKVYDGTGSESSRPLTRTSLPGIEAAARRTRFGPTRITGSCVRSGPAIDAHLDDAVRAVELGRRDLRVTRRCGVGLDAFRPWDRAGFPPPIVVAEQADPNPDFPTVAPEPRRTRPRPGARPRDPRGGRRRDYNDPDADRLVVAIVEDGAFCARGDELGWVLGAHQLARTGGDDRRGGRLFRRRCSTTSPPPRTSRLAPRSPAKMDLPGL